VTPCGSATLVPTEILAEDKNYQKMTRKRENASKNMVNY
jgi:hypothetical protein